MRNLIGVKSVARLLQLEVRFVRSEKFTKRFRKLTGRKRCTEENTQITNPLSALSRAVISRSTRYASFVYYAIMR